MTVHDEAPERLRLQEAVAEADAAAGRARDQLDRVCRELDAHLTKAEQASAGAKGWLRRRLHPAAPTPQEAADATALRESSLFDGAWYLATYPKVAGTGLSPALHYLRHGADEGKDPGPDFVTRAYVAKHPLLARSKTNPLLHHLRTHQ